MANFFRRGKKILLSFDEKDLTDNGSKIVSLFDEVFPLEPDLQILVNLAACNDLNIEVVSALASFAKDSRKSKCELKVTTNPTLKNMLTTIGLDRHFSILLPAS